MRLKLDQVSMNNGFLRVVDKHDDRATPADDLQDSHSSLLVSEEKKGVTPVKCIDDLMNVQKSNFESDGRNSYLSRCGEGVSLLDKLDLDRSPENDDKFDISCECGHSIGNDDIVTNYVNCDKCQKEVLINEKVKISPCEDSSSESSISSKKDKTCDNRSTVSLDSMLENIPLAYNPLTKQLHVLTVDDANHVNNFKESSKCNGTAESGLKHEVEIKSQIINKSELSSIADDREGTLSRTATCGSLLSKTDASSVSSISSLSTNTDFSVSAVSGNDLENGCCESQVNISPGSDSLTFIQEGGVKPKRRGISKFLSRNIFSRKSKDGNETPTDILISDGDDLKSCTYTALSPSGSSGWKIFSKPVPSISTPSPEHHKTVTSPTTFVQTNNAECVVANSTSGLILENRPSNLPAKSAEEALRHKQEYESMIEAARKKELKQAKQRKKQLQEQLKQEEVLSNASRAWNVDILPNWDNAKITKKVRDFWWNGLPPNVRGKVWKLALGNDLNITEDLYEICVNRARDRIRMAVESASICSEDVDNDSSPDKEGSVEFIKLDVSRTFPHLCIFQKGGPYYDMLHSLLGAYVCYRPDVGYVQGMSFLAAILILNLDVADAFICFANLLNKHCQMAFFRLDEPMMKAYFNTYEVFFKENLLKLFNHFGKQNLTADLYLMDWIYTLFSKSLPLDVACRVWDVFFRDGEEFLFRVALGILNLYKDELLEMDFIHLAQFLTKLPDDISPDPLFKSIEAIRMTLDKKKFSQVLASHMLDAKD